MKLNQNSLYKLLEQKELEPIFQPETGLCYIKMNISGHEVGIFFDIRAEGNLLQTIAYLPYALSMERAGELARLLHHLNREFDVPGFGMDERKGLMFFRCVIPCLKNELPVQLFEIYLATTRLACEGFMHAISMMASGKVTIDDIISHKKAE